MHDLVVDEWPIGKPQPYPANARIITDRAVAIVAESLRRYGWQQPIVVDEAGVVVVGHTRLRAAKQLGMLTVPVHVMRGVPQVRIDEYRIMDNRAAQETLWDNELLLEEIKRIEGLGGDIAGTGFERDEVDALVRSQARETAESASGSGSSGDGTGTTVMCPRCRKPVKV